MYFQVEKDEAPPPADEDVHSEDDCKVEEMQEPEEEDLDDIDLARALGAARAASIASSSAASLHTGLTADLEMKANLKDSPDVRIVTPTPRDVLVMDKRQKIEALRHPGELQC